MRYPRQKSPILHARLSRCRHRECSRVFELPNSDIMGRDENTPEWVQHIAFEVKDYDALVRAKTHIEGEGLEVLGPVNHGIFKSIYFFDPNGHRIELAANTGTPEQMRKLHEVAPAMIEEWAVTKRAPRHAAWLHEETS